MSDTVWVSDKLKDVRLLLGDKTTDLDRALDEEGKLGSIEEKNRSGLPLPVSDFPKLVFPGRYAKGPFKRLPQLFKAGSYFVISGRAAEVLRDFDLGSGNLYPVKVVQKDKIAEFGEGWHCINFGNVKEAFLPEESNVQRRGSEYAGTTYFTLPFVPKDYDVAVSKAALEGPDIWVDPKIYEAFFVSERLGQALTKAKLDRAFGLYKCRITAK